MVIGRGSGRNIQWHSHWGHNLGDVCPGVTKGLECLVNLELLEIEATFVNVFFLFFFELMFIVLNCWATRHVLSTLCVSIVYHMGLSITSKEVK